MNHRVFDLDVLRSFSTGVALGSYARAADKLGRSTSAMSAQLKKLESQAGTPLLRKAGRGLELTDAGQTLLAYAHRMLALNDEAAAAMRGADLHGWVRLGLQEDLGEGLLPGVLGRFTRAHPHVRIEACVARSGELRERVAQGRLDLALLWDVEGAGVLDYTEVLTRLPLQWIVAAGPEAHDAPWWVGRWGQGQGVSQEPLPLLLLDAPCPLREIVTHALDRAGLPWRHGFTSASLGALWAATSAGLGLSARTSFGLPRHVKVLDRAGTGLPALPETGLVMVRAQAEPEAAVARLADLLREAVLENVSGQ